MLSREGVLLNERGKYSISDARWKECDKRGCKIGSWRVICVLTFSKNSAQAAEGGRISCCQPLYPTPPHCYSNQLGSGGWNF